MSRNPSNLIVPHLHPRKKKKKYSHLPFTINLHLIFGAFPSCSQWFNDLPWKTSVCTRGKHAFPGQDQLSRVWGGLPDLPLELLTSPLLNFLLCHQALHHHQPWKSFITQDDNIETIKPTYISKTASLLSVLQVIKICHNTHRPLEHWTWWVVLRRPLLRPKPFFIQGLCRAGAGGHSKCCTVMLMVIALGYYPGMDHCSDLKTHDWIKIYTHSYTYTEIWISIPFIPDCGKPTAYSIRIHSLG